MSAETVGNPLDGQQAFHDELIATIQRYKACGFHVPHGATASMMLTGIAGSYLADEMPAADRIANASPAVKYLFGEQVRPALSARAERGDTGSLALAHQVGRLLGAAKDANLILRDPRPYALGAEYIYADGIDQPFTVETGWVADYGMGLAGLTAHIKNVKANTYNVVAIQHTPGETAALRGMAEQQGIEDESLIISPRGIDAETNSLLERSGHHVIDLVVASQVQSAGRELMHGIAKAHLLLRPGGILLARGPRSYSRGYGYDRMHGDIKAARKLRFLIGDHFYTGPASNGGTAEPSRSIMAQLPASQ